VNDLHITRPTPAHLRLFHRWAIAVLAILLCQAPLAPALWSQDFAASAPDGQTGRVELQMLDLINRDRLAASSMEEMRGRGYPLQWDAKLAAVAQAHSEEMARSGSFSHMGLDGSTPAVRVSLAGIQWRSTGENIAMIGSIFEAETAFMNEPKFERNHRANILNPNYTRAGVGIARGADGSLYITQEFAEMR
jgi:uncharacterized protein YkwD